ncbi:gustatory receptor for bitter taste 22e-like [Drosophila montana]|uniref:gustatory receptor for bitter taste 22e-like n=1 Tax=Drosophila montana TaxID=40370 RepID=UPI00313A800C
MWPARRTWRQKFARLNLWATLYASWALGLFPFIYNSSTKKLRRSTWLVGYGIILNLGFKLFVGLSGVIAVQISILLIGMHFHLAVLYIYRSVWIVNRELLTLANQLRMRQSRRSSRIHELHCLYSRLLGLSTRLGAIYDYQMTLFMISLLSVNILSIFYMIVYSISLKKILSFLLVINFIQALSINLMDFWLSIAVCDLAERAGRGTSAILKLFNDIPELDVDLDRSINDFALFCCHRRLRFNHCGLFYVHNAMGFRMIVACVLYLIYLVQFDYMNL